jgi:hypothetical protein
LWIPRQAQGQCRFAGAVRSQDSHQKPGLWELPWDTPISCDVYAARTIAGTGGYLVGTLGNEVSLRGNEVSACGDNVSVRGNKAPARGNGVWARRDNVSAWGNEVSVWGNNVPARRNEVSPRGNDLSARGNQGTDRGNDIGKGGDKLTGVRIKVYTAEDFVGGGAWVLPGATARPIGRALLGRALPRPMVHAHDAIEDPAADPSLRPMTLCGERIYRISPDPEVPPSVGGQDARLAPQLAQEGGRVRKGVPDRR